MWLLLELLKIGSLNLLVIFLAILEVWSLDLTKIRNYKISFPQSWDHQDSVWSWFLSRNSNCGLKRVPSSCSIIWYSKKTKYN